MSRLLPLLLVLALVAMAGVAIANPGDGDTLHACALHNNGWLRLVNGPDDCATGETPVSWNQTLAVATSCSVAQAGDGEITMTCPDGTSATWIGASVAEGDEATEAGGTCTGERPEAWSNHRGCDFTGVDLSGMFLYEVNLTGADLRGVNLSNTAWWNVDASGADLSRAGRIPADLSDGDLTGVDLRDAALDFAVLTNFTAEEVDLSGASLYRVQADNADFIDSDLSGVDLTGADISDSTFTNVDMTGADLSHSFAWSADFTGVDMTGVLGLDTVIWGDTACPDGSESSVNGGTCVGHLDPAPPVTDRD